MHSSVSGSGKRQPMYGNDCSGFVGFAWGISPSIIVGGGRTFNSSYIMDHYKKLSSLSALQEGDVLVNSGHTFLVSTVLGTTVYCYEQTPFQLQYAQWEFSTITSQGDKPYSEY